MKKNATLVNHPDAITSTYLYLPHDSAEQNQNFICGKCTYKRNCANQQVSYGSADITNCKQSEPIINKLSASMTYTVSTISQTRFPRDQLYGFRLLAEFHTR